MRISLCSLFVVISALLSVRPGEGSAVRNLTAVLGQSVTLRCPGRPNVPVKRLYIQKDHQINPVFINGFDRERPLDILPQYKNRTKINQTDLSMEMTNISVSDEGLYSCVVFFNTLRHKETFEIYLNVTAEYSIPTVTEKCSAVTGGKSCQLSCSSVGGYPQRAVRWAGLNTSLGSDIDNKSFQDPQSETWTIIEVIPYFCSQPISVNCSIGGAVSNTVTICKEAEEKFPLDAAVISAIIVVLLLVFVVSSAYALQRCSRRRRRPDDGALGVPLADCHSQPHTS